MNKTNTKTYNLSTQIQVDDIKTPKLNSNASIDKLRNEELSSVMRFILDNIFRRSPGNMFEDLKVNPQDGNCNNNTISNEENTPRIELCDISDYLYKADFEGVFYHGYDKYTKVLNDVDMVLI